MEVAPYDRQAHALRLAGTRCELEGVARPGLFLCRDAKGRDFGVGSSELRDDLRELLELSDLVKVDERLGRFALAEVVPEVEAFPGRRDEVVVAREPVKEKCTSRFACIEVAVFPPFAERRPKVLSDYDGRGTAALDDA